jgi:transcription antitermination factor NusG
MTDERIEDQRLQRHWYVLHTKSRHEAVVHDLLCRKAMEAFLPKIKVRSSRRDRKLMIHLPLFPGYVFVKTDLHPHTHLDIVKTAGAVRLIGTKAGPVPVAEETVESLKIMVAADLPIATGPFAGVTGTFVRYRAQGRVVVNIEALGQFAGVDVQEEDIEILPPILS